MASEHCPARATRDALRPPATAGWTRLYGNLLEMATVVLRNESHESSLDPPALVHEAFLRLHDESFLDDSHLLSVAARTFRNVLVDQSRRRRAARRGGTWRRVRFERAEHVPSSSSDRVSISEALEGLTIRHRRARQTVELKIFGGLSMAEIARNLGVSPRTVDLDWHFARTWLRRALDREARPAFQRRRRRRSRAEDRG